MKIAAVIAEYNPFHNGHNYMIEQIRKITDADYIIAVMSGDFTQRGLPGIADKHTRAAMAVACGVDAVFELPALYATASAEQFAFGAVTLLKGLRCVNYLVFGSECGEIAPFLEVADFLAKEPVQFKASILKFQKLGFSYPKAFSLAIRELNLTAEDSLSLLSSPNNLLGVEYVKAIKKYAPDIHPVTLSRVGTGYHDTHSEYVTQADAVIASASAIRNMLQTTTGSIATALPLLPDASYRLFCDTYSVCAPIVLNDFSLLLSYRLSMESKESLTTYSDVSEDLADRILKYAKDFSTFEELADNIKHKQYTHARITRALLHILLGIKKDAHADKGTPYARLLAMKKSASPLMKAIKADASVPVITKPADAKKKLTPEEYAVFELDLAASDLYHKVASQKFSSPYTPDIKMGIRLLP